MSSTDTEGLKDIALEEGLATKRTSADVDRYRNFALLAQMLQHEPSRTLALEKEGSNQRNYPKSNEGWWKSLFIWRGRALDRVLWPFLVIVLHATICIIIQELVTERKSRQLAPFEIFFGVVANSALAFLLVFRLNRAAERYWIARELWGLFVARSRSVVDGLLVHGEHKPQERDVCIRWVSALGLTIMEYMRGFSTLSPEIYAGILSETETKTLEKHHHPPLYVGGMIRRYLHQIFAVDGNTSAALSHAWTTHHNLLENQLNILLDCCGGMERIRSTPLPIVYVSHLRTFLLIALFMYPYALGPYFGWYTIPITALSTFALIGIECAAAEVECPFHPDRVNALDMDTYCIGLLRNIEQLLIQYADNTMPK